MSIQTALDNIRLKPSSMWSHTEYSLEYDLEFLSKYAGVADIKSPGAITGAYDKLSIDFLFSINDGLVDWAKSGRITEMGHAAYAADGSDQRMSAESPFKTVEDVWGFDAVKEYGLPDFNDQVSAYENSIAAARKNFPNQLVTGGYYKTLVSGAIASFGWDMLLMAASQPDKMERVFDSFFKRTLFHMEAWAKTGVEAVIQHDDFVWTSGAFMNPEIYRKTIIPRYAKLWKPLHDAGKKLLFCSDGNFMEFAEDIVKAGADGLIFEPCNDYGFMADNFGKDTCLVGSYVDCRDLTFNKWEKVKADIDRTFEKLSKVKGAILAVGNHLPSNIPVEMLVKYFDYLLPKLSKQR